MKSAIIGFVTLFVLVCFFGFAASAASAQPAGKKAAGEDAPEPPNCLECTATYESDNKGCAMKFGDLKVRAKCRDDVLTALRKCLAGCR